MISEKTGARDKKVFYPDARVWPLLWLLVLAAIIGSSSSRNFLEFLYDGLIIAAFFGISYIMRIEIDHQTIVGRDSCWKYGRRICVRRSEVGITEKESDLFVPCMVIRGRESKGRILIPFHLFRRKTRRAIKCLLEEKGK
jgi:hypothetical protein